jgi:predicted kinase
VKRAILVLTGTCGSGKSTVAALLAAQGWLAVSEDEIWKRRFGIDRGAFGTDEHRRKRAIAHAEVMDVVVRHPGRDVVVDATVHKGPPEAYEEYAALFAERGLAWHLRVLHPSLEEAIRRDAGRTEWHAGPERVASLRAKFTARVFPRDWFLDTSDDSPEGTVRRVLASLPSARPFPTPSRSPAF